MAKKIEAWTEFGPRLEATRPVGSEEVIESLVQATNQSRGSVLAVLAELDALLESHLRAGRIVHLPNRTHYLPKGTRDGRINVNVRVNPDLEKSVNTRFRGVWINAENIGKTEAEIIDLWNEKHPDDPIEA